MLWPPYCRCPSLAVFFLVGPADKVLCCPSTPGPLGEPAGKVSCYPFLPGLLDVTADNVLCGSFSPGLLRGLRLNWSDELIAPVEEDSDMVCSDTPIELVGKGAAAAKLQRARRIALDSCIFFFFFLV